MEMLSVIDFTEQGQGKCLYTEAVDLRTLGRLRCERASLLEFNDQSQQWEVAEPDSARVLFTHPSRDKCLQWERRNLKPAPSPPPSS